MDSNNRQQTEDVIRNLDGREAVEKIQEIVKSAETCFFCTSAQPNGAMNARPMNVRQVDEEGNFWFLSAKESRKNAELTTNPVVTLFLQGSPHSDFLHIEGEGTVLTDRAKLDELWTPLIKAWFTEGKDDPRISLIKVTPRKGYYWDNKHGDFIAAAKFMFGAIAGKPMDDSVTGTILP